MRRYLRYVGLTAALAYGALHSGCGGPKGESGLDKTERVTSQAMELAQIAAQIAVWIARALAGNSEASAAGAEQAP